MSVWRYRHDPKWTFPRPIRVGRRLLWRADEIEAWEEQRRVA
jgi:predicted DNA-binding transcriptional regulator AlpA